jgi:cell wall-associated NlpC family hydrolase
MLSLGSGACAARSGVPRPRPFPGAAIPPGAEAEAETPPAPARPGGSSVVTTALGLRGTPYRNGGSDPSGFDCSGFVQYVFARHGLALPREVRDLYRVGDGIDLDDVRAGDLLFFQTISRGPSHVGVAIGGDRFVHAPSSRGVVRVERYRASYWASRFVGARRLW